MSNTSGYTLHKILSDPEAGLEIWPKLKLAYFNSEYTSIYSEINKFYEKQSCLPTFNELLITVRSPLNKNNIKALQKLEVPEDVDLIVLLEALVNEYVQNQALIKLDEFVTDITILDSDEIKSELANLVLFLEEKTHTSEEVVLMSDFVLIDEHEVTNTIKLGLNTRFDISTGGLAPTELFMIGGYRGAGKSVVCSNIAINQYLQGNSCIYFSIEMRGREIFNRCMSALSGIDAMRLKNGTTTELELQKVAVARANMFNGAEDILAQYTSGKINYREFEAELLSKYSLKQDNQLVIVDNQRLTIADIDLHISKFKAQFKDKLKVAVVDYVNAIETEDNFNWESQINLSKSLKDLARKYDMLFVAPYQIDKTGEARFAKGILDKADVAVTIEAADDHILFKSTKTRGMPAFEFKAPTNWNSLTIENTEYVEPYTDDGDGESDGKSSKRGFGNASAKVGKFGEEVF